MVDEEAVEGEGRGGSGAKILRGKGALALYLSETTKSKDSPQVLTCIPQSNQIEQSRF